MVDSEYIVHKGIQSLGGCGVVSSVKKVCLNLNFPFHLTKAIVFFC